MKPKLQGTPLPFINPLPSPQLQLKSSPRDSGVLEHLGVHVLRTQVLNVAARERSHHHQQQRLTYPWDTPPKARPSLLSIRFLLRAFRLWPLTYAICDRWQPSWPGCTIQNKHLEKRLPMRKTFRKKSFECLFLKLFLEIPNSIVKRKIFPWNKLSRTLL